MHIETALVHVASLVRVTRSTDPIEADWRRAFALARLCVLGGVFCLLPLTLVAMPHGIAETLGVFVAVVGSAAAGLMMAKHFSPLVAAAVANACLAAVLIGPWPAMGGYAAAAVVLAAALCDIIALPVSRTGARRWLLAMASLTSVGIASLDYSSEFHDGDLLWFVALPLLCVAPMLTLVFSLLLARARLGDHAAQLTSVDRPDAMRIAGADVGLILTERGGHVLDLTRKAAHLLGCDHRDLAGRGLVDRVLIADRPAFLNAVATAAAGHTGSQLHLRLMIGEAQSADRGPPAFENFDLVFGPVPQHAGQVAIKLAAHSEQPVVTGAVEGHGASDTLLRLVTHEIRTPLHAILGYADVLADPATALRRPEQIADYARIMRQAAREVLAVSNAMIELMRTGTSDTATRIEAVDLAELVAGAIGRVQAQSPRKITLIDAESAAARAVIHADPQAVQVLVGALLQGFVTAFDERAEVQCVLTRNGLDTQLVITAKNPHALAVLHPSRHAAHLGVIEALAHRLSRQMGLRMQLVLDGPELSARLEFPRDSAALHGRGPSNPATVMPLRKSA